MATLATLSLLKVFRPLLIGVALANPLIAPLVGQLGYRKIRLLVPKGNYSSITTTGSFPFEPSLGGGTISFSGHGTWNNSSAWGPQQLFDNTRSIYDWCNAAGTSPLFGEFTFPRSVTVAKIFLVPRSLGDFLPTSVTLIVDGATIGTYSVTTISAADGLGIPYSGSGYNITPNLSGTIWKLAFNSDSNAYLGELEFWGY